MRGNPLSLFVIAGCVYLLAIPLCYAAQQIIRAVRDARDRVRRTP